MNALIGALLTLLAALGGLLYLAKHRADSAEKKVLDMEQQNQVKEYNGQRTENLKALGRATKAYEEAKSGVKNLIGNNTNDSDDGNKSG